MFCSIYKITNTINNKIYIGQTWKVIQDRFVAHKDANSKNCLNLHNAFNKHGRENFQIELIIFCHTQEIADYWEMYFIQQYDSVNKGYNIRLGGSRGKHSEETKRKISASSKGKIKSEKHRKNLSISHIGHAGYWTNKTRYPMTEEWIANLARANQGKKKPPRSKEHLENLSKALKGKHKGSSWKLISGKRVWVT